MQVLAYEYVAFIIISGIGLYFLQEASRKYLKYTTVFAIVALITVPFFLSNLGNHWFRWVKTLSVLIPVALLSLSRYAHASKNPKWAFLRHPWVYWMFYGLLFLNITEAVIADIEIHNYMNALSGVLLCIMIPLPHKSWRIIKDKHHHELIVDFPVAWIILYTTWNLCFIYGFLPAFSGIAIAVLSAPLLYSLINKRPELWMSGRAYTLGAYLYLRTVVMIFVPFMGATSWFNLSVAFYWGSINLLMHLVVFGYWVIEKTDFKKWKA